MRIQSIRFKNLNSLVGEWRIDLTDPAYTADGIFAITGPTGTGKSTILDAICLALYGRTPRLNRVNKNSNEIMSRQTGDCFAEVCFETQSNKKTKRYISHWAQHRARKKAQGDLQNPKHEISDADSGEVLESKLSAVAQKIIQISGMDFERFTRSMLLAQGGFAAFLQADADERAPILEQITGTDIYSRISIKVHEYRAHEQKQLEILQAEMSGMELLSEEDESLLQQTLKEKVKQETIQLDQYKEKNKIIQWKKLIEHCEKEQQILDSQQQQSQQRLAEFEVQQEQLNLARKALELNAEYATISAIRKEQENDSSQLLALQKTLPEREIELKESETNFQLENEHNEKIKIQQKEEMAIIRQARELDLQIHEKEIPIAIANKKVAEVENALKISREKITNNTQQLNDDNIKLQALDDVITKSKIDKLLVEQLTGLKEKFNLLRELDKQKKNKQQELIESEQNKGKIQASFSEQSTVLEAGKKELIVLQKKYDKSSQNLEVLLENKEVATWRNELAYLQNQQNLLENMLSQYQALEEFKVEDKALNQQSSKLDNDKLKNEKIIKKLMPEIKTLQREVALLEDNLSLQNKIQSLDEERKKLKDDEQCPLCGAIEHPYALGNLPDVNQTKIELEQVKHNLSEQNNYLSDTQILLAGISKELEQISKQKTKLLEKMQETDQKINELIEGDNSFMNTGLETIQQRLEENKQSILSCSAIIKAIEKLEKQLLYDKDNLQKSKEQLSQLKINSKTIEHQQLSSEKTVTRLKSELNKQESLLTENMENSQVEIKPFNINELSVDKLSVELLDDIEIVLSSRRQQWLKNNEDKNKLVQIIDHLNNEQRHQNEIKTKLESDCLEQQELIKIQQQTYDNIVAQRQTLFADKNADEEADKLLSMLEKAENTLKSSRQKFEKANHDFLQLQTHINTVEKEIVQRETQLKQEEESFKIRMQYVGFASEESFKNANLSEEQRHVLIQQEKVLNTEQTELAVKIRDNNTKLAYELQKALSDQSSEQLLLDYQEIENQLKILQGELGAVKQKLADNTALRKTQESRAQLIDKQKQECSHWNLLHNLIGSADGKKYRNFAQGLTFEMMVGHANQQLQKMTQRYLLIRDQQQPLELNVVDNFQAGEVRSTKNLSGGESFIVSLSLALGLSQMASKNVRVDSLFLDEGFGTLDEEALDTALETLSGLQQEGKLIGVISHVQALKDRISTQIVVKPLNGGKSEIIGPGVLSGSSLNSQQLTEVLEH
ncbi:MAG: AAA family ATPase [Proteobacteria bacterium]|nr:AAA family ATPase [Pseudomonadota bacterium]